MRAQVTCRQYRDKAEAELEVPQKEKEEVVVMAKLRIWEQAVMGSDLDSVNFTNWEDAMESIKNCVLSQSSWISGTSDAPYDTDIPSECQPPVATHASDRPAVHSSDIWMDSLKLNWYNIA